LLLVVCVVVVMMAGVSVSVVATGTDSPVPFVLWSPSSPVEGPLKLVEEKSWLTNVRTMLHALTVQPTTIVAFIYPKLSSAQFSAFESRFSSIKNRVEKAESSMTIGQLSISSQPVHVSQFLRTVAKRVSAHVLEDQSCDQILKTLSQSNLQGTSTSLEMFWYPSTLDLSVPDQCTERVLDFIDKATQGKYIAVLSADSSTPVRMTFNSEMSVHATKSVHLMSTTTSGATNSTLAYPGVQYITPVMLFAVMFGFFFLLALYCGLSCLHSVQTPLRFPSRKIAVGKEF